MTDVQPAAQVRLERDDRRLTACGKFDSPASASSPVAWPPFSWLNPGDTIIDVHGVTFMDAHNWLVAFRHQLENFGAVLSVTQASHDLRKLFAITSLT